MSVLDEAALAAALRSLASGQPAQPGDRLAAVSRRARRLHRRRTAVSVAAVLALAVPIGVALTHPPSRGATFAGSAITGWPDRSQGQDKGVGAGALADWSRLNGGLTDVRWLFRGDIALRSGATQYLAVFTARVAGSPTLVVAMTGRDQVDGHGVEVNGRQPDSTPWSFSTEPLNPARLPDHVGVYLTSPGTDNQLFVLAAPEARQLTWESQPLPFADRAQLLDGALVRGRSVTSRNGVFSDDAGVLTGLVRIRVGDQETRASDPVDLAGGLSFPYLAPASPPPVPAASTAYLGSGAQTHPAAGGGWVGGTIGQGASPTGRVTVFARCYGGGRLRLSFEQGGGEVGPAGPARYGYGAVSCDGESHRVLLLQPAPTPIEVGVASDRLQVYAFDLVVLR